MKFLVIATPGPVSPPPKALPQLMRRFQEYAHQQVSSGRNEINYLFASGGGFGVVTADSSEDLMDILQGNPLAPFSSYEVHALLDFDPGIDRLHALTESGIEQLESLA